MGIKHFFYWFKKNFSDCITNIGKNDTVNVKIDTLLLDLNGIFHNSCQKIFKYGNFKDNKRLITGSNNTQANKINYNSKQNEVFIDICKSIHNLIKITNPKKRVILCIDGCAPSGKQQQQRQRRFRNSSESTSDTIFDSNCITPGTKFMDELSIFIDNYIKQQINTNKRWQNIQIVFSNEKVPGEGEHKAVEFVRNYGLEDEIFCINGPDADLIMLSLATHKKNFYVLRDDLYDNDNKFFLINISKLRNQLVDILKWDISNSKYKLNKKQVIDDFIFICFMVGNDFLPHIPSIEIIENGLEIMFDIYKDVAFNFGHLTKTNKAGKVFFERKSLCMFLYIIGKNEKQNFEYKLSKGNKFFPDLLMIKHSSNDENNTWDINIDNYLDDYHDKCFGKDISKEHVCHDYIQGLQWVLSYYTSGVPSWKWYYKYHYAPPASVISKHVKSFKHVKYGESKAISPFEQLLCVLPISSVSKFLPNILGEVLQDEKYDLKKFYPDKLTIDMSGKRKEWEGIVLLPFMDQDIVKEILTNNIDKIDENDLLRNTIHDEIIYKKKY